jgi:hypothetical protein
MTSLFRGSRRPSGSAPRRRSVALSSSLAALAIVAVALPGCGSGGSGNGGSSPATVAIQTTSLPSTTSDAPYLAALSAWGGVAPYQWSLASGYAMPPGLSLSNDGVISGSATALGSFSFAVVVVDSGSPASTDTANYSLLVATFDASIAMLHFGDAWTGEEYPVSSVGSSSTTYQLVANASGATLVNANPPGGTVTYHAGAVAGTDRIRATSVSGSTKDIDVSVVKNPIAGMTGRFSTTDVWHLRFEGKFDASHPYDSDFHWALATVGMRDSLSTSETGTTADELASLYVRQQVLRHVSLDYLNNGDGTAKAGGLAISFPFIEPAPPHVCPADGAVANPAANQFNVVSLIAGGSGGVIGTGYLDDTENSLQENDTTSSSAGTLGVFVDEITPIFNAAYSNGTLSATPVSAADVPALKALLYGLAKPAGSRYDELQRIGEGFGKTLAAVAAHEIGHSLGLAHTSPAQAGSIMNASAVISPSATYVFIASDVSVLQGGLPGPGRGGSPLHVEAQIWVGPGEGDVGGGIPVVCNCRLHRR